MTVKRTLRAAAVLAAVVFILVSCTGVPIPEPKSDGQAILIIPHEYNNEMRVPFVADYTLYANRTDIGSAFPFTIDISTGDSLTVYRMLPPTSNRFTKLAEFDKETGEKLNVFNLYDVDFILAGGKINILPYSMVVKLTPSTIPGDRRKPVQRVTFDPLTDDRYREVVDELVERGANPALIVKAGVPE